MPTIGIDLRMVEGRLHGIARYALELAHRLPKLAPTWRFFAVVPPAGLPPAYDKLAAEVLQVRCTQRFLSPFEQPALARTLFRQRPDLFHATSFSLPALWPGRLVATLHDANHLALRENYGPGRVAYYRLFVGPRARRAEALITVSEFSRQELAAHLRLSPYRLQVISNGVDERFQPLPSPAIQHFRSLRRLPAQYFAVVGNPKPHKNLALLAKVARALPVPIALVAGAGAAQQLGFPPSTLDLGELSDAELPAFYAGATALLLPSLYEGFGLPLLEAMASGCPVIASRAGALPEVLGEAGILVSATDEAGFRDAALRVLHDKNLRRSMCEKGLERAARFRWEACAQKTLAVYERALGRS